MEKRYFVKLGRVVVLVGILMLTSGCAFMIHEAQLKGSETGYSVLKPSLPSPEQGKGRLFVYLTSGGPSASWALGIGAQMNGIFTIDDTVYNYLGGSYFYVDLPAGPHSVTAEKVGGGFRKYRRGKNVAEVELRSGQDSYVRIDLTGVGVFTTANPILVDRQTAEDEIAELRIAKNYETEHKVTPWRE